MQEKKVFKDLLQVFKKTVSVSFKISPLLLLILILSYSVNADDTIYNNAHNDPVTTLDASDQTETGMLFFLEFNATITNAYKHTSEQSTNCYLYYENSVIPLQSGDFSGNNCTFNNTVQLNQSYYYTVTFAKIGTNRARYKKDPATYPENVSGVIWTAGRYRTTGDWLYNITTVTYSVNSIDLFNETLCISEFANTTFSDWVHMQDCNYENEQDENRSYIMYDLNGCVANQTIYEFRNHTCYTSTDIYNEMKVNNMFIGLIILYVTFLALGVYMLRQGNKTAGFMLFGITIPIDFLIVEELYTYFIDGNVIDSTWQSAFIWIFGIGLMFWLLAKISVPLVYKWKG